MLKPTLLLIDDAGLARERCASRHAELDAVPFAPDLSYSAAPDLSYSVTSQRVDRSSKRSHGACSACARTLWGDATDDGSGHVLWPASTLPAATRFWTLRPLSGPSMECAHASRCVEAVKTLDRVDCEIVEFWPCRARRSIDFAAKTRVGTTQYSNHSYSNSVLDCRGDP
jgi:hypothetical protein